jgi:hypothetical protein
MSIGFTPLNSYSRHTLNRAPVKNGRLNNEIGLNQPMFKGKTKRRVIVILAVAAVMTPAIGGLGVLLTTGPTVTAQIANNDRVTQSTAWDRRNTTSPAEEAIKSLLPDGSEGLLIENDGRWAGVIQMPDGKISTVTGQQGDQFFPRRQHRLTVTPTELSGKTPQTIVVNGVSFHVSQTSDPTTGEPLLAIGLDNDDDPKNPNNVVALLDGKVLALKAGDGNGTRIA